MREMHLEGLSTAANSLERPKPDSSLCGSLLSEPAVSPGVLTPTPGYRNLGWNILGMQ